MQIARHCLSTSQTPRMCIRVFRMPRLLLPAAAGLLIYCAHVELFNVAARCAVRFGAPGAVRRRCLTPACPCHMVLRKADDKVEIATPGPNHDHCFMGGS